MSTPPTLAADVDGSERLSADDQATLREGQFLAAALQRQQAAAAGSRRQAGVCQFCHARCLPLAAYCDEDCRADDEREQLVRRRQGRAR